MLAVDQADVEMAKLLKAKGANLNPEIKTGDSPLHLAAMSGKAEMATWLIESGAALDATDSRGARP